MDPTELGMNKTGTQMSPRQFREMTEGMEELLARLAGTTGEHIAGEGAEALSAIRASYLREAEPLGSVPVPGTLRGVAQSGAGMLTGRRMQALVDKIGERLAFERAGTRLYDALLGKVRERTDEVPELSVPTLERFRNEEAQHFALLAESLRELGADPTAQTPCAALAGIEGMGLIQAVSDPRTSVAQSLHAVLAAELIDDAGWELLIRMTRDAGHEQIAGRFEHALRQEAEHLATIKQWFTAATLETGHVVREKGGTRKH